MLSWGRVWSATVLAGELLDERCSGLRLAARQRVCLGVLGFIGGKGQRPLDPIINITHTKMFYRDDRAITTPCIVKLSSKLAINTSSPTMGDVWSSATTLWESTVGGLCIGAF